MIKEVKLPEVSDNVESGDVLKVLVKEGDKVEVDQPLVELETEKATFEVPSTESGIIKEVKVKQGDELKIGGVIVTIETNGEGKKDGDNGESDEDTDSKDSDKKEKKKEGSEEKKQEEVSEEDSNEKEGNKDEDVKEEKKAKSSDKKSAEKKEVTKDKEKSSKSEDEPEEESDEDKGEEPKSSSGKKETEAPEEKVTVSSTPAPASPSVRKLARELGVDINSVTGSGPTGRISEEDLKAFVKGIMQGGSGGGSAVAHKALPDFSKWGEIDEQPMSKIRSLTADAMSYAWSTIPMVTQFDKADITKLEEFRKAQVKKSEDMAHLTITAILVKVCEAALRHFPQFNSSIDFNQKKIIYKKYFNIGIAVDTDRGLLVPVIKNVDKKKITDISKELTELAEKARNKKIMPDEMDGGNFTISNLGGIGGTSFTPIVYSPQVAILGVSRGSNEAKFVNGQFVPSFMLPLTLTYDHRIIDGADAARFLRWVCDALENPMMMFL